MRLVYACHHSLHRRLIFIDNDKMCRANIHCWLPILDSGLLLLQELSVQTTLLLNALPVGKPVGWDFGVLPVHRTGTTSAGY